METSTPRYDVRRIKHELRLRAEAIRETKKRIRTSNYLPSWQDYSQLRSLQREATQLCCLRASLRGRRHLPNKPAVNDEYVKNIEEQYRLKVEVAA